MHPACPNKKQNHLQNSLLRRTQFWVRNTFSKPASLKRASLVVVWLLRFGPFSPGFVPLSCPPLGWSFGAFWSSQCTAGPSGYLVVFATARVSCLWYCMECCDGLAPVFTSPHGNKGFGLCGVLPSTPCCGCRSGALLSCAEVFTLG